MKWGDEGQEFDENEDFSNRDSGDFPVVPVLIGLGVVITIIILVVVL